MRESSGRREVGTRRGERCRCRCTRVARSGDGGGGEGNSRSNSSRTCASRQIRTSVCTQTWCSSAAAALLAKLAPVSSTSPGMRSVSHKSRDELVCPSARQEAAACATVGAGERAKQGPCCRSMSPWPCPHTARQSARRLRCRSRLLQSGMLGSERADVSDSGGCGCGCGADA